MYAALMFLKRNVSMNNFLDEEYKRYKEGKERNSLGYNLPNPITEEEPDFTKIRQCPNCAGFNVSVDMSTNKTTCNECKKCVEPRKVDFERKIEKIKEQEEANLQRAIERGVRIG